MRRAIGLMMIGLAIFGMTALGAVAASSGMLTQPTSVTPVLTGSHTTVPVTPVRWGRYHDRFLYGTQVSPSWGGYWSGGYYYPYYNYGNYGNRWPNYLQQYCTFDGYSWDCSPS